MYKFSLKKGETGNRLFWEGKQQNPYSAAMLQNIDDENSQDIAIPVTSIPSPFARMQLFETAFDFITRSGKLEGNSLYHRLASDCLDVYEMLFRVDELHLRNKLEFVKWTPDDLEDMKDDLSSAGEKVFAKTIQLYIDRYNEDTSDNPFSQLYIILYDSVPIAGTSPYTGFFTTANPIEVEINYYEKRKFFKGEPMPLHKRENDFQEFINLFMVSYKLPNRFKIFNDYIVKGREQVQNRELKEYFKHLSKKEVLETINSYPHIEHQNSPLYILPNIPYRKKEVKQEAFIELVQKSDYLAVTKKNLEKPPIVLKEGLKNTHWKYLKMTLPANFKIPANIETIEYDKRVLPETTEKYPYIVIDDILPDYLIELDYQLNSDKFFIGTDKNPQKGYLLPIKADYFKFFTMEDLREQLKIEVTEKSGGNEYNVRLNIPVKAEKSKGKITYEKNYLTYENIANKAKDKGAVIKAKIYMGFYPFYKIGKIDEMKEFLPTDLSIYNDFYKSFIYYEDTIKIDCSFVKYKTDSPDLNILPSNENGIIPSRTRKDENFGYVTDYYELSNSLEKKDRDITYNFLSMQIGRVDLPKPVQALVIPNMYLALSDDMQASSYVSFDIGTTNSFVAYATNPDSPITLSTKYKHRLSGSFELQLVMLHKPIENVNEIEGSDKYDFNSKIAPRYISPLLNEFMPSLIEPNSKYKFPIKTVICWDNDANIYDSNRLSILSNINIPFAFGIKDKRPVDYFSTNLKWNVSDVTDNKAKNQLTAFIKQLTLLARNTLLLNGYNPQRSKVIWFKPLSMGSGVSRSFETIWQDVYSLYFSKQGQTDPNHILMIQQNLRMISESAAPFFVLQPDNLGQYFLNIDIGGGTTDMVVYNRDQIVLTTSLRFAGNSIFGNGLNPKKTGKDNGIAKKYTQIISKILADQNDERQSVLGSFSASEDLKSEDIINFLFTVKEFSESLKKDPDIKILFLLHNAAIFYHAAQMMKNKGFEIPKFIGLSGNGAKILEITNGSANLNGNGALTDLATAIFENVFGKKANQKIQLITSHNPKEATAYGGIKGLNDIRGDSPEKYMISLGDSVTVYQYKEAKQHVYEELMNNDKLLDSVADNVIDFFNLFFDVLWKECDFTDNYLVGKELNPKKMKTHVTRKSDIKDCLINGIDFRRKDKESEMNETLFFYPVTFYLFDLSKLLVTGEINNFKN